MTSTEDIVRGLSDTQVAAVVEELFNDVYTEIPYEEVRSNAVAVAAVGPLTDLDGETMRAELSPAESVRLGRLVLEQYARDPALSPLVRKACERVAGSDDLFVSVILAVGLVANLALLVATTEVEAQTADDGTVKWKITKKQASADVIKAIVEPIAKAAKSVVAGG